MRSREASPAWPAAGFWRRLRRWWLDRAVRTKGLIVVAIPLVALLGTVSASLVLQHSERNQRTSARAAQVLTSAATAVLLDAVNAETGVRGYAATGDPVLLAPYYLTLNQIGADQRSLRGAAVRDGATSQVHAIDTSTSGVLGGLAALRSAVSRGASGAALRPALLNGKAAMDALRRHVEDVASSATAVGDAQRSHTAALESEIQVLDVTGLVLGLLAGLVGMALFTSGISRRVTAAAANADRLGEGQPLEPVQRSADDLGHLADSIIRAGGLLAARAARRDRPRLALLAAIVDSSDDAIVSTSLDGLITSWNPAAESIYGYPAAEAVGQHAEFILEASRSSEEAGFLAAFVARQHSNGSSTSMHHETVRCRKDGTTFPASEMLSAIRDDDGALIGTSTIARDITEQARAGAERLARIGKLERANQYLETFTYSVSHDLRAPLRGLAGYSAALLEDCGDALGEDGRDYAHRIQAASDRMGALIDDLLGLSRLWRTEIHEIQPVDLSAEVASIAAELQRGAPGRHVRFTIQDAVRAPGDQVLLRSVLENLVGNAWKFTSHQDDALIEFGTTPTAEAPVCCYVRDNGAGFDPTYIDKLFTPFERLHATEDFPGTGVGLASVRQVVERHGGRVWADGAVGKGATFYFTLDAKEPA